MTRRTRLGKVVGSVRTDFGGWGVQPSGDGRWFLVAPSGAKMETYATETQAQVERDGRNAEWYAPRP